ncbi:MAG TPA: hypothetical protein VK009_09320 [Chloroflexota bacterium]|nr:hypothetical protein [Chloroflexota bacterium]
MAGGRLVAAPALPDAAGFAALLAAAEPAGLDEALAAPDATGLALLEAGAAVEGLELAEAGLLAGAAEPPHAASRAAQPRLIVKVERSISRRVRRCRSLAQRASG